MAFKFDFSFNDDPDGENDVTPTASPNHGSSKITGSLSGLENNISHLQLSEANSNADGGVSGKFEEITLEELIHHLPPALSYSALHIPLTHPASSSNNSLTVLRRDLFDARFQLLNEEDDDSDDDGSSYGNSYPRDDAKLEYLSGKGDSDLIKGVYEGGLKTWEASLDLVDCLHEQGYREGGKSIRGQRLLEVGCGTAMPSIYLLEMLFKELLVEEQQGSEKGTKEESVRTVVHLQDYNPEVLLYITFCNIILAFWNARKSLPSLPSSSSPPLPSSHPPSKSSNKATATSEEGVQYTLKHDSETELNELELTTDLIDSFTSFLENHSIEIKLFSGAWEKFPSPQIPYSLTLTSETVYELDNLPHLTDLLERCAVGATREGVDNGKKAEEQTTLVACKRVYFGVGGGEVAFKEAVREMRESAEVENVWNSRRGVETTVMRVKWT